MRGTVSLSCTRSKPSLCRSISGCSWLIRIAILDGIVYSDLAIRLGRPRPSAFCFKIAHAPSGLSPHGPAGPWVPAHGRLGSRTWLTRLWNRRPRGAAERSILERRAIPKPGPSAARTMVALSSTLAHHFQRARNVAASVL